MIHFKNTDIETLFRYAINSSKKHTLAIPAPEKKNKNKKNKKTDPDLRTQVYRWQEEIKYFVA